MSASDKLRVAASAAVIAVVVLIVIAGAVLSLTSWLGRDTDTHATAGSLVQTLEHAQMRHELAQDEPPPAQRRALDAEAQDILDQFNVLVADLHDLDNDVTIFHQLREIERDMDNWALMIELGASERLGPDATLSGLRTSWETAEYPILVPAGT